jgi:hypothetical protein
VSQAENDHRLLEFESSIGDVVKPAVPVLFEAPPQESPHRRRGRCRQRRQIGLVLEHRGQDGREAGAGEGAPPGERLVEARAERPDVGAGVGGLALGLLRRHVRRGAEELPAHRGLERERR